VPATRARELERGGDAGERTSDIAFVRPGVVSEGVRGIFRDISEMVCGETRRGGDAVVVALVGG